jgi:hypothetical protein
VTDFQDLRLPSVPESLFKIEKSVEESDQLLIIDNEEGTDPKFYLQIKSENPNGGLEQ